MISVLGIPASKFNDDRLGRTLDALYPHLNAIWGDIVAVALQKSGVDLSVIFYDVTAFVTHGQHADNKLMDFGFAHNTAQQQTQTQTGAQRSQRRYLAQLPRRQRPCCQTACAVEPVRPEGASLSPCRRVTHQEGASASRLHSIHWLGPFARRISQTLTQILSLLFDFQRAKSRLSSTHASGVCPAANIRPTLSKFWF
ncbi:MAG: hypothetical protein KGS73_17895 [Chloroflexi bacterium]|nr:hypothetical protein [Chloroflexota bacterium]